MSGTARTVLVTDGEQRAALAIVRSLGGAGYHCIVVSSSGRTPTGASRYAEREVRVPDAGSDPTAFVAAVKSLVEAEHVDLILPVAEPALLALLPARDELSAALPFPDIDIFRRICDKAAVLQAAAGAGIHVPRQVTLSAPADPTPRELGFPVVLKPARSVYTLPDGSRHKATVRWARSDDELRRELDCIPAAAYPVLLQEAIEGPGIGIFVLLHAGRLIAAFSHRRIREKPPSGGVSVLRQSEPIDQDLLARSLDLLHRLEWSGVAMVEYKRQASTGRAYLMEINGRFWGSLQLAVDAGVDFPGLLAEISLGGSVAPIDSHRFVRSRWFWGDVDHLIAVWRDAATPWSARFTSFGAFLRAFGPGYRSEVFRWVDPAPFVLETYQWCRNLLGA